MNRDTPDTVKKVYKVKCTPCNPYSGEPCDEPGYILFEAERIEEIRAANRHYKNSTPCEIATSHARWMLDRDDDVKYSHFQVEDAVEAEMTCREMFNTPPAIW